MMSSCKILIAASGSGGHLLPAVQIAKAIKTLEQNAEILFVGTGRPLEAKLIDAQGFKRVVFDSTGVKNAGLAGVAKFLISLPVAIWQVQKIFSQYKPDIVVGVGGYVSVLPVIIGFLNRKPTWIHEAELKAGMANGLLSWFATKVSIAFSNARLPYMKNIVYTGHPVRQELLTAVKNSDHPLSNQPKVLILGGSQGAHALDEAGIALASYFKQHNLEILHQARQSNVDKVQAAYQSAAVSAKVVSFVDDMTAAYAWADIVVCRSGAGTVMEIEALNLPCIFVPYPFAQGNHQEANAKFLSDRGKAAVVKEGQDFSKRLGLEISSLINQQRYREMLNLPSERRSFSAAEKIAAGVLELLKSTAIVRHLR